MKLVRCVARPQGTFSFHTDRKTMQAILKIIQEQYNVKFDGISCLNRAFETVFPRISQQKDTVVAQSDDASESE